MHDRQPGRTTAQPAEDEGPASAQRGRPGVGKSTLMERREGAQTPNLGASGAIKKNLQTQFFDAPNGTMLKVQLSASMFGAADHDDGQPAKIVGGGTRVKHGKPESGVAYEYDGHYFTIAMGSDGGLSIDRPTIRGGDGNNSFKWTVHEVSKGPKLTISLEGTVTHTGKGGASETIGFGLSIDITAMPRPSNGPEPEPDPVSIPVKVLIPTLAGAAGVGVAGVLKEIFEGVGSDLVAIG